MEKKESWFTRNWFGIVSVGSKWGARAGAFLFFVSLILYWAWGVETLLGVKIAVVLWFGSQALGVLKGLR